MHIIITGGAGFIGSHLIQALFRDDPEMQITCIDNFDPFYPADLKQLNIRDFKNNPHFHFLYNDLAFISVAELNEAIEEPVDIIVHMAAKSGVRPSLANSMAYQQVNIIGLQTMLDFARDRNIKQFVFGSSSSVYGLNDHFPWKEDEQLLPISPYAMTKMAGEMLGHVYSKQFGIRFIALRYFTIYGPGQRPDLAIHKFIKSILLDEPITLYGDGSSSRDYTFIDDIVQATLKAIHYNQSGFEIFNIGNNYSISLKDLVAAIEDVLGKKAMTEQFLDQPGDLHKTFADISKAKKLLGYEPHTQLKDGLDKFYAWFVANKEILIS